MVGVFNKIGVSVSCVGNHELDYGTQRARELLQMTSPTVWLMANIDLPDKGMGLRRIPEVL